MPPFSQQEKLRAADASIDKILRRCAEDAEYYIFNWCVTKDEHDSSNSRKKFPDKRYLRWIIRQWIDNKVVYVAKSRQLMVSWLLAAFGLWTAQFRADSLVLWQSKKEEDAAPFIYEKSPQHARMSVMLCGLPEWLQVCRTSSGTFIPLGDIQALGSYARLTFPNGSQVLGLAQGASQVESKVPTLFISDEASLQTEWASAVAAARPAIERDAKILAVGTMRLPSAFGDATAPSWDVDPDSEGRGLAFFRTPEGVLGLRVHYSADPDKDPETPMGAGWKRGQLESEGSVYLGGEKGWRWQQHMEINPLSRAGTLVLPTMTEALGEIVVPDITPAQTYGWNIDAGLDYGVLNRCAFLVFGMSPLGHRYLLWEYSRPGGEIGGIPGFAREIAACPWFRKVNGNIWADPSLWNRDQNVVGGLVSKSQIFESNGVVMYPAKAKGQEADELLVDRLNNYYWADPENPLLFICKNAQYTLRYFPTLMYQEWAEDTAHDHGPKEKMRDLNVDEWDAMKYAEVAWPDYPRYRQTEELGTFQWYKRKTDPRNQIRPPGSGNLR